MKHLLASALSDKVADVRKALFNIFWSIGLASLLLATNLVFSQYGYAATPSQQGNPSVIQPFELTKPAATREEAYDEIAELNKDPKALIAAENKEEKAAENLFKAEQKAAQDLDLK